MRTQSGDGARRDGSKGRPRRGDKSEGGMGRGERPRRSGAASGRRSESKSVYAGPVAHLPDEVADELRATVRPGKAGILLEVFSQAAGSFAEEDFSTAIRLGEQAKHLALRAPSVRELLGLAYYRTGRWKEAARELTAYRRIAGVDDQNPVLADCYRAMGNPDRALQLCNVMDPRKVPAPVFAEGLIVAAGALGDMGRAEEAIAALERVDIRPEAAEEHHLRIWYVLADLLERRGRFSQARSWFEAVAAADPELTDAPQRARRLSSRAR